MGPEDPLNCSQDCTNGPRVRSPSSYSVTLKYILILPFNLPLYLQKGLFPSGFRTELLNAFYHLSWVLQAHNILHLITPIADDYKLCRYSLCNFLQPPLTSSHLTPNILLSPLFSASSVQVQRIIHWGQTIMEVRSWRKQGRTKPLGSSLKFYPQQGQEIFLYSMASIRALEPIQHPIQWVLRDLFPGVKLTTPSSAEVTNDEVIPPLHRTTSWCGP